MIDALPGLEPSQSLVSQFLERCEKGLAFEKMLLNMQAELGAASVRKLKVLARHAFGRDPDALHAESQPEWNRLLITRSNGQEVVIQGRGDGRWPAAEAR